MGKKRVSLPSDTTSPSSYSSDNPSGALILYRNFSPSHAIPFRLPTTRQEEKLSCPTPANRAWLQGRDARVEATLGGDQHSSAAVSSTFW